MKQVSASQAKNNFGGLLDYVAALGCVEIVKHGRPVAVVLSPRRPFCNLRVQYECRRAFTGPLMR